jgi:hypothetical protein
MVHVYALYLIVHPLRTDPRKRSIAHLKDVAVPITHVMPGCIPQSLGVVDRDEAIARAHAKCVDHYLKMKYDQAKRHLIIVEDDILFTRQDNIGNLLNEYLRHLDRRYSFWRSFHIGHIPLGPCFALDQKIAVSIAPGCAHCYALNWRYTRRLFVKLRLHEWRRPRVMEGMLEVPFWTRLCLITPVATQLSANRPKELIQVDQYIFISRIFDLEDISLILTLFFIIIVPLMCVVIIFLLVNNKKLNNKKQKLNPKGHNGHSLTQIRSIYSPPMP